MRWITYWGDRRSQRHEPWGPFKKLSCDHLSAPSQNCPPCPSSYWTKFQNNTESFLSLRIKAKKKERIVSAVRISTWEAVTCTIILLSIAAQQNEVFSRHDLRVLLGTSRVSVSARDEWTLGFWILLEAVADMAAVYQGRFPLCLRT